MDPKTRSSAITLKSTQQFMKAREGCGRFRVEGLGGIGFRGFGVEGV